jgi:hypothetical protein
MKTVIIPTGGCMFFGDTMPPKKLTGVCIAMVGIIWYTQLKIMGGGGQKQQSDKMQVCRRVTTLPAMFYLAPDVALSSAACAEC